MLPDQGGRDVRNNPKYREHPALSGYRKSSRDLPWVSTRTSFLDVRNNPEYAVQPRLHQSCKYPGNNSRDAHVQVARNKLIMEIIPKIQFIRVTGRAYCLSRPRRVVGVQAGKRTSGRLCIYFSMAQLSRACRAKNRTCSIIGAYFSMAQLSGSNPSVISWTPFRVKLGQNNFVDAVVHDIRPDNNCRSRCLFWVLWGSLIAPSPLRVLPTS